MDPRTAAGERRRPAGTTLGVCLVLVAAFLVGSGAPAQVRTEGQTVGRSEGQTRPDLAELGLVGNRFAPLDYEELTPAQKTMVDNVLAGPRNSLGGPFNVLLRSPEMGDLAQELGARARFNASFPARLREMAIIMTARHWTADFEWYAHKNAALGAGLDPAIVEAIRVKDRPSGMQPDETIVYDFCRELLEEHRVSDRAFAAAIDLLGERGVVDLVGTVGYYGLVSLLLNVDEYPLPEGVEPELR